MGEALYYLFDIIIFTIMALIFIFTPELIFENLKLDFKERTVNIIRVIGVIVAVANVLMNLNNLF